MGPIQLPNGLIMQASKETKDVTLPERGQATLHIVYAIFIKYGSGAAPNKVELSAMGSGFSEQEAWDHAVASIRQQMDQAQTSKRQVPETNDPTADRIVAVLGDKPGLSMAELLGLIPGSNAFNVLKALKLLHDMGYIQVSGKSYSNQVSQPPLSVGEINALQTKFFLSMLGEMYKNQW